MDLVALTASPGEALAAPGADARTTADELERLLVFVKVLHLTGARFVDLA